MKYDLDLDQADSNTSHAVVTELVGVGKRVLDIGCSTGYLARVLTNRGNVVSGVEIDIEAAKLAEPDLAQLVVGDLETIDLVEHFGAGTFDVIIFADVLEHLRDPLSVLRNAVPLLAPGGSVVLSIPNVAHGSVRLALLEGRFEYRPLGLLDDTHLRFFTRSSLEDLLRGAGLFAAEMRRTTAEVFATEIRLAPENFPAEVVEEVRNAKDSDTYQFVVRALPLSTSDHDGMMTRELVAAREEVAALRAQMAEITRLLGQPEHLPAVGLIIRGGASRDAVKALTEEVVAGELHRRLNGFVLRRFGLAAEAVAESWTGEPVHPLAPGDAKRAIELADRLDAIVLADLGTNELATESQAGEIVEAFIDEGCAVYIVGVDDGAGALPTGLATPTGWYGGPGDGPRRGLGGLAIPHPLLLADRLVSSESLDLRLAFLRMIGVTREAPHIVIHVTAAQGPRSNALARAVAELASGLAAEPLMIPNADEVDDKAFADSLRTATGGGSRLFESNAPLDLLAVIATAAVVVTDDDAVAATALAFRRPVMALDGGPAEHRLSVLAGWGQDPDLIVTSPADLPARARIATARAADDRVLRDLQAPVELYFDELSQSISGAGGRRKLLLVSEQLSEMRERQAALEAVNAALRRSMSRERTAFGSRAAELQAGLGVSPSRQAEFHRLNTEIETARKEATEALAERDAVLQTKTMRTLHPARMLYGRLRGFR